MDWTVRSLATVGLFFFVVFISPEGLYTTMVANEGLEKVHIRVIGPPGPTALHPFRRMLRKLQVKTPSEHMCSLLGAELSRLLCEKIYSGAGTWEPWSVHQRFNFS